MTYRTEALAFEEERELREVSNFMSKRQQKQTMGGDLKAMLQVL
jgi:hypothetical protein